jgi:hypothetical protein
MNTKIHTYKTFNTMISPQEIEVIEKERAEALTVLKELLG